MGTVPPVSKWMTDPDAAALQSATDEGLTPLRRLHQMRRALPFRSDETIPDPTPTRAFRPGLDNASFLVVNNAAFAWHPEQGGWTDDDLQRRMAEPWFDPEGFRIAEVNGDIIGFCWTKVHRDEQPPLGEIFVIAVAPQHAGKGLGKSLTVAGLEWLWDHARTSVGMLFVESTNAAAIAAYEHLGFTINHTAVGFG